MTLSPKPFIGNVSLIFVVLTLCQTVRGQSAQVQSVFPHALLWRISGNGLQKPSYLFGTMHLNDKRLFRFDDSVYRAIEKTEGLAIEVNPDEMAAYFVNQLFDQIEKSKKLQDIVDQRYFDRNRKALTKKFNKPAEEINASDIVKEKNRWMSEYMEKGEMPTFMDAYLYNIARRQGKWVGGIEDLSDQAGLMSDLIDQSDINYLLATDTSTQKSNTTSSLEKMISLYSNEDLEGIESSSEQSTAEQKDILLIHRNIKMARRIDSLVSVRTMFLAIGAAHLPGDSGVINLLRRKGYTLEPVFSTNKIAADDYTFNEVHIPWVQVADDQGYYTAEMPANPGKIKLYGLIEMRFLLDLFNMSGFCTTALMNTGHANRDSIFRTMSTRMFHDENVKAVKNLELNGIMGKEYIHIAEGGNLRVQIFANDKMVYMVMVSSLKKEMLRSPDANKFFQSFTIKTPKEQPDTVTAFTDSIMGISFSTRARLTFNEKFSQNTDLSWKVTCLTGIEPSGAVVMLFSKEVKPGYHIPDENALHDQIYKGMQTQYSNFHKDSTMLDSVKIMEFAGQNNEQSGIYLNMISLIKDGRQIAMMMMGDSSALKPVFHSLNFIPHPSVHWQKYESPDSAFTTWAPAAIRPHFYKGGNKLQWVSYDTTTATSYQIIPDTLEKYSWYRSDSLFWKKEIGYDTINKILLQIKDVANGQVAGKEIIVKSKTSPATYARVRLLITGDKIYKLFVAGQYDICYTPEVIRFFDEFRFNGPTTASTLTVSKASLLLHDLGSSDSATRREAYLALSSTHFGKQDASLLKNALFQPYQSPYDSSHETISNYSIARKLAELNDSTSVTYARESYPSLGKGKPLKNVALSLLIHQHSTFSYSSLAELLKQGPTGETMDYPLLYAMKDSLALTRRLLPALQSWIRDTSYTSAVAFITLPLLDSGYVSKDSIMPSAGAFINAGMALLPALKASDENVDYRLYSLLGLIGRFRTPTAYSLLKNYVVVRDKNLLQEVVKQLLVAGQAIPVTVLNRLAADPAYRLGLYDNLKKYKKTSIFPGQYLTQLRFAEASVYGAANDDDDERTISTVVLLSKKMVAFDGKMYRWYLYKVSLTTEDGLKNYLGIAGGYNTVTGGLKPQKDMTGIYWEDELDEGNADSLFSAFLKGIDSDRENVDR